MGCGASTGGCCAADAIAAEEDPPTELTSAEVRLWTELAEMSFSSSADSAEEPSNFVKGVKQSALVFHAKLSHGITGTMDTTPDGKIYEAVEFPPLAPRQTKRINDWMKHVKLPKSRSEEIDGRARRNERLTQHVHTPASARSYKSGFDTASSASDSEQSGPSPYYARPGFGQDSDESGMPPLEGDLPSDTESGADSRFA